MLIGCAAEAENRYTISSMPEALALQEHKDAEIRALREENQRLKSRLHESGESKQSKGSDHASGTAEKHGTSSTQPISGTLAGWTKGVIRPVQSSTSPSSPVSPDQRSDAPHLHLPADVQQSAAAPDPPPPSFSVNDSEVAAIMNTNATQPQAEAQQQAQLSASDAFALSPHAVRSDDETK